MLWLRNAEQSVDDSGGRPRPPRDVAGQRRSGSVSASSSHGTHHWSYKLTALAVGLS